mmetsp:Transcript_16724/g.14639  ORF Transcript_16724/g.14639 Transcript_16724/m.14639 type:complete len:156 (-) Transcript_16724:6-473(-)
MRKLRTTPLVFQPETDTPAESMKSSIISDISLEEKFLTPRMTYEVIETITSTHSRNNRGLVSDSSYQQKKKKNGLSCRKLSPGAVKIKQKNLPDKENMPSKSVRKSRGSSKTFLHNSRIKLSMMKSEKKSRDRDEDLCLKDNNNRINEKKLKIII